MKPIIGRRRGPQTTCKICQLSVFDQDATVWVRSPLPGIAHEECSTHQEKDRSWGSSAG